MKKDRHEKLMDERIKAVTTRNSGTSDVNQHLERLYYLTDYLAYELGIALHEIEELKGVTPGGRP